MHTQPMPETAGTLTPTAGARPCPKCGATMTCEKWKSSDGGHEDYKYTCANAACGHVLWIDGVDS